MWYILLQVKLIVVQSVLSSIYSELKSVECPPCVPNQLCIDAIVQVSSYPIQALKILAKAVISLLSPILPVTEALNKSLLLDAVEIQTLLNCIQGRTCLNKALILPMAKFMDDLTGSSNDNKVALVQWNAPMLITMSKEKQEDPVVLDMFDKLMTKLRVYEQPSNVKVNVNSGADSDIDKEDAKYMDQGYATDFEHLTQDSFHYFNIFNLLMKHFHVYAQDILATSAELTPSIVNSIATVVGFVRHMMTMDEELCSKICFSIAENSQFLSLTYQLIQKWPGKHKTMFH